MLILDESILFRVALTGWLPRLAFDLPRPIPSTTKLDRRKMRRQGGDRMPEAAVHDRCATEAMASREYAARIAQRGVDEIWGLIRLAEEYLKVPHGLDAVRMQHRICSDAMSHGSRLRPNLGIEEIERLCREANPRYLALEARFWKTLLRLM